MLCRWQKIFGLSLTGDRLSGAVITGQILGAGLIDTADGIAVLGARRAGTEDTTRDGLRVLVVVLAAGAAGIGAVVLRKKS